MEPIKIKLPSEYTKHVDLETLFHIAPDVSIQDYMIDARIVNMGEVKELVDMYGSLGQAGWSILRKSLSPDIEMTELEEKIYSGLRNTFKGLSREDIESIITETSEYMEIHPSKLRKITSRHKQRHLRTNVSDALTVSCMVGSIALWAGSNMIEVREDDDKEAAKKKKATRIAMKVVSVVMGVSVIAHNLLA